MDINPDKQDLNKPLRDEKGRLLPGYTANPNGRPKGKTLKEYKAEKFRNMSDEEKEAWLKEHNVTGDLQWRMAEGQPHQTSDMTSKGEKITPIYAGSSVQGHDGNAPSVPDEKKD